MKLTNKECLTLLGALRELDAGRQKIVKDGDREKVVPESFDLTIDFTFSMGVNISRLEKAVEAYTKANALLIRKHSVDGEINPQKNPTAFAAYDDEHEKLLGLEQEIKLTTIKRVELGQNNKIPMRVIAGLLKIMPDETKDDPSQQG